MRFGSLPSHTSNRHKEISVTQTNISEVCAASVIVLGDVAYRVCNFVRLNESLYDTKRLFLVVGGTERNFDTSTDNLQQIVGFTNCLRRKSITFLLSHGLTRRS
jgi:hypothetical protein